MKAFFKHFGSKHRLAAILPPPHHDVIIEPFAGSAAYSTTHAKPGQKVILYDTDERVCLVWDYLIHASPRDIMALPVEHFLKGGDIRELNLKPAQHMLIQRWLSISGSHSHKLAPCLLADREGESGNTWCEKRRAIIASQVARIRNWEIHQESYDRSPGIIAHRHVDPPYQHNKHGHQEYKQAPLDYEALGNWCKRQRGTITVHEQEGATWLPFETLRAKHATSRTTDGERQFAHEIYWTNDRRDRTGTMSLFGEAP